MKRLLSVALGMWMLGASVREVFAQSTQFVIGPLRAISNVAEAPTLRLNIPLNVDGDRGDTESLRAALRATNFRRDYEPTASSTPWLRSHRPLRIVLSHHNPPHPPYEKII
jgi:hypothetical protein